MSVWSELSEKLVSEAEKESVKIDLDRALAEYYCRNKRYSEGLELYKKITEAENKEEDIKKFINYTVECSRLFFKSREWDKVLKLYKDIIEYENVPKNLRKNIGLCLTAMGSHEQALKFFKEYRDLVPDDLQIYSIIGEVLWEKLGKFEEAVEYYEKALELGDKTFMVYNTLGHLYSKIYRDSHKEEQVDCFEKAYSLEPKNEIVVKNLAYVYGKFNDTEKADKMWKEMLQLNPPYADIHSYGAYLVKQGRFQEGFNYLRSRFKKEDLPGAAFASILKYKDKMWKMEEPLNGKNILIHYEQGFGDTIMFIRYVNQLKKMLGVHIEVIAQDSLIPLLKHSDLGAPIRSRHEIGSINFDVLIPMMDLPLICGTTKDTIPYADGYLSVPTDLIEEYRKNNIENSEKFKIGFSFEGAEASLETKRDIPVEFFYELMRMENVDMYCFQVDDIFKQLDKVPDDCNFKRLGSTFRTWEDTACAMECMDLIITTDNGILNLAGALGKKTFGIFNSMSEWRWIDTKGEDVKWYKSVKPFACDTPNNWAYAMNNVMEEVKKLL